MESQDRVRVVREFESRVAASPEKVFPLLCPTREYDWIDGWACDLIYSESGVAEDNCVFVTDFPERGGEAVWTVTRYDPERRVIQFAIHYPGKIVEKLDVRCEPSGGSGTVVHWKRTYTSLGEKGARLVEILAGPWIEGVTAFMSEALNHYCRTGTKLARPVLGGHG
jgi:hypothetical protein